MSHKTSVYEKRLAGEIKRMPGEFLPNLLEIVKLFRESLELKPAKESFRQGWKESLAGETMPVSKLWDGIIDDK